MSSGTVYEIVITRVYDSEKDGQPEIARLYLAKLAESTEIDRVFTIKEYAGELGVASYEASLKVTPSRCRSFVSSEKKPSFYAILMKALTVIGGK